MIRSLPLAVLTRPVYAWASNSRRDKSPTNGALKLTALSSPRRKRLGYVKVIH